MLPLFSEGAIPDMPRLCDRSGRLRKDEPILK